MMPRHPQSRPYNTQKRPFVCSHCCAAFTARPFLRRHLSDVHGQRKPLPCRHCGKTFAAASYLTDHIIRLHKGNTPSNRQQLTMRCAQCTAVFKSRHGIIWHLAYRHNANCKSVRCNFCPLTFVHEYDMHRHRKMMHLKNPEDRLKCKLCPLSFNCAAMLRRHKLKQHAASQESNPHVRHKQHFACARCAKSFKSNLDLSMHLNDNLCSVKVLRFPCKECRASFMSRTGLRYHWLSRHSNAPLIKPFKCETCTSAFMTATLLKSHRKIHSIDKRFLCDVCKAPFNCHSSLANHRNRKHMHKPHSKDQFFCAQCCKRTNTRTWLHFHIRGVHLNERPYQCTMCSLSFKYRNPFVSHMNRHQSSPEQGFTCARCLLSVSCKSSLAEHLFKHIRPRVSLIINLRRSEERPYACATCQATFKTHCTARKHLLTHSQARSIVCPLCGHRLKHKWSMKYHFLSKHAGRHEFKCKDCASKFVTRTQLKLHEITHKNVRQYMCSLCPSAFKRYDYLRRHEQLHSAKTAFQCGKCFTYFKTRSGLRVHDAAMHTVAMKSKCFACAICICRYTTKWALEHHIGNIHLRRNLHCGKVAFKGERPSISSPSSETSSVY